MALCYRENILNNMIHFRQKNLSYIRYIFNPDRTRQLVFFFSQKARQDADGRIIPLFAETLRRQNTVWKNLVLCPLTTDGKCDCKKPKLWKNTTLFMTLTNNYAHAIMKQKKTCFVIAKTSWMYNMIHLRQNIWVTFATSSLSLGLGNLFCEFNQIVMLNVCP